MFNVTLKCGNCGHLVDFEFRHVVDHTERTPEQIKDLGEPRISHPSLSMRALHDQDRVTASAHTHCPRCRYPTLIVYECSRVAHESIAKIIRAGEGNLLGGSSVVSVKSYYPMPPRAEQSPFWPASLREIFADAQDMLVEGKTPSIILSTARSVLEIALRELDGSEQKEALFRRIERLHEAGVITSPIKDWAHEIRLDGNASVHDGVGDRKRAAEYIEFLKLFLDMAFTLPRRIQERRQNAGAAGAG